MKVREIMTTGVETAAPDSSLREIAKMMKDEDVGSIPIVDGDELTGIVTDRDIVVRCIAAGKDPSDTNAEDILSGDLQTVEPDEDVEDAARIMAERQIRRLPVCESGKLVGMISIGDIAVKEDEDTAGEALEEISEGVKGSGGSESRGKKQPAIVGSRRTTEPGRDYEGELASAGSAARNTGKVRGRQSESARGRKRRKAS